MLKCSLPSAHPLCALEKTTSVHAAGEILAPGHFPGKGPISSEGQDCCKELKCLCTSTSTVLCPSTGTHFHMCTICYWHTCSEEGDTLGMFFLVKELYLEVCLPWVVSKSCMSSLDPQQHGTETGKHCCSPQYSSFLELETEKAYGWF